MSRLPLGDFFVKLAKLKSNAEKVEWFRKHTTPSLLYLLQLAYHDEVRWVVPADAPPFKKWQGRPGSAPSNLKNELRRLYLFIEGGGADTLGRWKREQKFQYLLEGLEPVEVGILVATKDKKLDKLFKFSWKVIEEAYPGFLDQKPVLRFAVKG